MCRGLYLIPFTREFNILQGDQCRIMRKDDLAIIILARFNVQVVNIVRRLRLKDESVSKFRRFITILIL